ncbi:MAG: cyclic nucleotide-binding domain-containing protein [Acidobacteriota bacterium]|nr:cyclic nucleotide-binding domain-containing protein [Acidobacteriota bacterium]
MSKLRARFKTTSATSGHSRLVEYQSGQFVFRAGDLGTEMYVIHSGKVEVMDESPAALTPVAVLEKGDFFGEMAVLEGVPRIASVRAVTDVKLVRVDGATFTQLLRSEPEIAVRIMRKLSRRLRASERKLRGDEVQSQELRPLGTGADLSQEPALVHEASTTTFRLPEFDSVLIGRKDPITGIQPTVDLSVVDPERSCSRQHAKILRDGSRFLLVEDIGTTNGTYLNNRRLETGVPEEITHGDKIRFGTVTLRYEFPRPQ